MTPLIREFINLTPESKAGALDPLEFKWFDITESVNNFVKAIAKPKDIAVDNLPFPKIVIVGQVQNQKVMTFVLGSSLLEGGVCVGGLIIKGLKVTEVPVAYYTRVNGKIAVTNRESIAAVIAWKENGEVGPPPELSAVEQDKDTMLCAAYLAELLRTLDHTPVTGYVPTVRPGYISSKRVAKGKLPLYDWNTVVVEPPKPKSDYRGGTHASPRHHERRGHMRRTRSGKQVWVRHCKVGNPANGTVFHDYQVRSM